MGPLFNLFLALLLIAPVISVRGKPIIENESYIQTVEDTPLYDAGFRSGDRITALKKDADTE